VDGVMLSEHIVMGPSAGSAGRMENPRDYAAPGNQDPATPWPDSIVLMSAIAAATTRLRLIGGAIIAPLRHPLVLAHQLAALDLVSEGRLVVQPTVSWHEEEYRALGVPFHQRGALLDEPCGSGAPTPGRGDWRARAPRSVLRDLHISGLIEDSGAVHGLRLTRSP
jgi:alkanesulfonate monooxygenase SsuD/methylene tetrahydromethanopterin reductase-like flavin-dependent oxidoreductase (luciferase family)